MSRLAAVVFLNCYASGREPKHMLAQGFFGRMEVTRVWLSDAVANGDAGEPGTAVAIRLPRRMTRPSWTRRHVVCGMNVTPTPREVRS